MTVDRGAPGCTCGTPPFSPPEPADDCPHHGPERHSLPDHSETPLIAGALYRHPARRGRWRLETAGPKWVSFRSVEVAGSHGRWLSFKERREDWPNGWTQA